jgi:four helix bundle protein
LVERWGASMGAKSFEELRVYQQAEELADLVWDIVLAWQVLAKDTVGRQMIRAADSIGANIAEGHGRGSYQDNRRFVRIARGSLYETRHWLRRAYRRKLLSDEQVQELKAIIENLGPQLNAYLKSIGPSKNPGPLPNA